jgi:hypothetical protein
MLAAILNETIIAGMVVLLLRRRTARIVPCSELTHFAHEGHFALLQLSLPVMAMRARFLPRIRLRAMANRANVQIRARPDKRQNALAG